MHAPVRIVVARRQGPRAHDVAHRLREGLSLAGVQAALSPGGFSDDPADAHVLVDPAGWLTAESDAPAPTLRQLRRSVTVSLATPLSAALSRDRQMAERAGASLAISAPATRVLRIRDCPTEHLILGVRPAAPTVTDEARDIAVATVGGRGAHRLNALADGMDVLDALRCAHHIRVGPDPDGRFPDDAPEGLDVAALLRRTVVLADIATDVRPRADLPLLLLAAESGAAVVTERDVDEEPLEDLAHVLVLPRARLWDRVRDLADDPAAARELAARARTRLDEAAPLRATGAGLVAALDRLDAVPRDVRRPESPRHPPALPPRRDTVRDLLRREVDGGAPNAADEDQAGFGTPDASPATETVRTAGPGRPPRVSIVVPAYAAGATLVATLDSAARQAGDLPIEIVVVDDASPGEDARVAAAWADAHPHVPVTVVRHRTNGGLSAARNTATSLARAALVLPLDADNLLRPHALRRLVACLDADPGAAFAFGILSHFDDDGPRGMTGLQPWDPGRLRHGNDIDALALLRRDVLIAHHGYRDPADRPGWEDWDLWCRLASAGERGAWTPQIVGEYRVRPDSMLRGVERDRAPMLRAMLRRHPDLLDDPPAPGEDGRTGYARTVSRADHPPAPERPGANPELPHPMWVERLVDARDHLLPWLREHVPLAGATVLEYGCGQGAITCGVAPAVRRHIGLDIDHDGLRIAGERLAMHGITNAEMVHAPVEEVVDAARRYTGEIDVVLLCAVVEHLTLDERLEVLRMARDVVRPGGHVVVYETPNRLTAFDWHTSMLPALHQLPPRLAVAYADRSQRPEFAESIAASAATDADGGETAMARWGQGASHHEFELVFGDLAPLTVGTSYHPALYPIRTVRGEELQAAEVLAAHRPDLSPSWHRTWIDVILAVQPEADRDVRFVSPWAPRTTAGAPGVAMGPGPELHLNPGARLEVRLDGVPDELHVGYRTADPTVGPQLATADGIVDTRTVRPRDSASPWYAIARPVTRDRTISIVLPLGGTITFVGWRPAAA